MKGFRIKNWIFHSFSFLWSVFDRIARNNILTISIHSSIDFTNMCSEVMGIHAFLFSSFPIKTFFVDTRFDEGGLNQFSNTRKIRLVKYNVILSHCEHHLAFKLGKMFDSYSEMLNNRHVITCQMLYNLWYVHTFAHTIRRIYFDGIIMHGTFHFSDSAEAKKEKQHLQCYRQHLNRILYGFMMESNKCLANVCISTLFQFFLYIFLFPAAKLILFLDIFFNEEFYPRTNIAWTVNSWKMFRYFDCWKWIIYYVICMLYVMHCRKSDNLTCGRHSTIWTLRVWWSHRHNVPHVRIRLQVAKTKVLYDMIRKKLSESIKKCSTWVPIEDG